MTSPGEEMREAVARELLPMVVAISSEFTDAERLNYALAKADAILRLVSLGEPVAWQVRAAGTEEWFTAHRDHERFFRGSEAFETRALGVISAPPSTQEASQ